MRALLLESFLFVFYVVCLIAMLIHREWALSAWISVAIIQQVEIAYSSWRKFCTLRASWTMSAKVGEEF